MGTQKEKTKKIEGKVHARNPFFMVPNDIFDLELDLDIYEKMIYIYLRRCANNGSVPFPSYNTIADKCCMSRRKAIDTVNSLIEKNFLSKEKRENQSNIYHVIPPQKKVFPEGGESDALGSESHAPGVVNDMHQPSAQHAPNKELLINKETREEKRTHVRENFSRHETSLSEEEIADMKAKNSKIPQAWSKYMGTMQLTPRIMGILESFLDDGLTEDAVIEGIKITARNATGNYWSYLKRCLNDWINREIKTAKEVRDYQKERGEAQSGTKRAGRIKFYGKNKKTDSRKEKGSQGESRKEFYRQFPDKEGTEEKSG